MYVFVVEFGYIGIDGIEVVEWRFIVYKLSEENGGAFYGFYSCGF